MSLLETDSGDDGEVRHKRFDYSAPSLAGIIDFFSRPGITDVQAGILLNQTPQEIHQLKKHIRCYLRAPCPWDAPNNIVDDDGKTLCRMDERPLGWMVPTGKQGELFRHLVVPPIAKLYPDLFKEPDLETQIRQDQPNGYGRFKYAPYVVCKEALTRLIETCAQDMRAIPCLRDADTESNHISPRPKLKRCRLEGPEKEEDTAEEGPVQKKQMTKPFEFAHIKAIVSLPPLSSPSAQPRAMRPNLSIAPPESDVLCDRPIKLSGAFTVSELLEQERAARLNPRLAQSASSPASTGISPRHIKDSPRKDSLSSTTSNERTPTSNMNHIKLLADSSPLRGAASKGFVEAHGERGISATVEYRRLRIGNLASIVRKRDIADFFDGYYVGAISLPKKHNKYGYADFATREQAKRAMNALDRTPLLGYVVDIEIAQMPTRMEEK